jgi:hypothetical protein
VLILASDAAGVAGITAGATVIAALIIALITAKTTSSRQERQLVAEAQRQREELQARTDGQKRQLDHARELADLADLRKLLDEFAVAIDRGRAAREEMVLLAQTARHVRATLDQQVKETADPAKDAGQELLALTMRLRVRLGESNRITSAADEVNDAMHAMWQQVELLAFTEDFSASLAVIGAASHDFARSSTAFMQAAVDRAGTVETRGSQ